MIVGDYYGEKDIVILTGLHAGDRVVVDGVLRVVPGQPVKIVEPGAPRRAGAASAKAGERRSRRARCSRTSSSTGRILSSVISILIVLGGAVAMAVSPIEQYPDMAPPQVTSRRATRARPRRSSPTPSPRRSRRRSTASTTCSSTRPAPRAATRTITVVFAPGSNGHQPGQRAEPRQPGAAAAAAGRVAAGRHRRQEVVEHHDGAVGVLARRALQLHLHRQLRQPVRARGAEARPGANRASVFGLPDIAMRVWLQPRPHGAARHLGAGGGERDPEPEPDLRHRPDRRGPTPPGVQQQFVVTAQGLLTKPEEFEDIIVRTARKARRSCACATSAASSSPSATTRSRAA